MTPRQSTNHLLMIEPAEFYANPETMATNVYQVTQTETAEAVFTRALCEFRAFRDALVESGVTVTTAKGVQGSPDMVFPNWFFALPHGRLIVCPMLVKNRQSERTALLVDMLRSHYPHVLDWTGYETQGRALESTASIVSDHVNKVCYSGLSARTDRDLAQKWADMMGYRIELFETQSHTGKPVYHTDVVMWIGNTLAGICANVIVEKDRARVLESLKHTHEVIEFTAQQLQSFCGNALQVLDQEGHPMLAISEGAYKALREEQKESLDRHFTKIITSPLPTLERYGGGSARCTLAELF